MDNENVEMLGTVKEVDMEAVMACEPDVIFMGGRMAESYDALSEIAPVVRLTADSGIGVVESVSKNAKTVKTAKEVMGMTAAKAAKEVMAATAAKVRKARAQQQHTGMKHPLNTLYL